MSAPMLNESELDILRKYKTEINISIDSFQDNIQSYTRGAPVSLQNALKSVRKISEKGIQLSILTVITKYNYHDLFNFLVTAYEKGIKQVLFQPVIYYTNYPDRHPVDNKAQLNVSVDKLDILMEELRKILQFEKKHNINTNVYRILPWIRYYLESIESKNGKWFFDKILKKFFCRDTFAVIDISYDGGIQPCFLTLAKSSIHENRHLGLMNLWYNATIEIRDNLNNGRYYEYCNSCCNHFSRNMLASIMKYPFQNRSALIKMFWLLIERFLSKIYK
jgi:MoaA/NifB/PqqE/SkfB family radical SAM enzyme